MSASPEHCRVAPSGGSYEGTTCEDLPGGHLDTNQTKLRHRTTAEVALRWLGARMEITPK